MSLERRPSGAGEGDLMRKSSVSVHLLSHSTLLIDHGINNADSTQFPHTSLFNSSVYGNGVPQYRPKVQLSRVGPFLPLHNAAINTVTRDLNKSSGRGEMTNEL